MSKNPTPAAIQNLLLSENNNSTEVASSVRLPLVLKEDLKEIAKEKNVKYSELLKSVLGQYVIDNKYSDN